MISSFTGHNHFLSNFFKWEFEFQGLRWPTAEHAFQSRKTPDPEWKKRIRTALTAGKAKELGRKVPLVGGVDAWNAVRVAEMREVLRAKFSDRMLKAMLLETGDERLVEGNYWRDSFWGVVNGRGENMLGKLLMEVREEIRGGKTR